MSQSWLRLQTWWTPPEGRVRRVTAPVIPVLVAAAPVIASLILDRSQREDRRERSRREHRTIRSKISDKRLIPIQLTISIQFLIHNIRLNVLNCRIHS